MEFEYLIIFLPLIASIISGFFSKIIGVRNSEIITSLFVSISAILSFIIFYNVIIDGYINNIFVTEALVHSQASNLYEKQTYRPKNLNLHFQVSLIYLQKTI